MRWPKGPPHLALDPPYFLIFVFCLLLLLLLLFFCLFFEVFVFLFLFFGGFKGQVRWPKGPPHLALNPPYLFFFAFFCFPLPFLYLLFNRKTLFFPLKKANFAYLSVFPFVSLLPCLGLPPFPFLFLCLSLVIFFLPSFLFFHLSFWFFLFIFVWFASWFKMLCCFSFSACCLFLF